VPYADFADPQTLNLYQFVAGNPASKADPDGHQTSVMCSLRCNGEAGAQQTVKTFVDISAKVLITALAVKNFFSPNQPVPPPPPPSVPVNKTPTTAPATTATSTQTAVPASQPQSGTASNATTHQTDIVVTPGGTAIPTDRDRIRDGFDKAGFPSKPATKTNEPGTIHTVPTQGGPVDVRVMDGSTSHPPRIVVSHPGTNNPKTPEGKATNNKEDSHIPAK
jgi:hypothetical protein